MILFRVNGQENATNLYGFHIGQFRETAKNEFGKPFKQEKFKDGFEYEIFLLNPDTSLYIVFEYAAGQTDIIWSIQISGSDTKTDLGFKNLRLGLDNKKVEKILGKPDTKEKVGQYGERWMYKKTNYSIEISTSGKLSSVKIKDTYSGNTPDIKKLPTFEYIVTKLKSGNNAEIANILAPGIEIYVKDKTLFFEKSIKTEIETDYSKIFETIKKLSVGLDKINTSDENAYEENMRISLGQNAKHVVKIKTGHIIKEIVFEYINGQYLIWEIKAN